jgi:hypothetical protein
MKARRLSRANRARHLKDLERLLPLAATHSRQLLADDLARLAEGEDAPSVKPLSLLAHRVQLAHSTARELGR